MSALVNCRPRSDGFYPESCPINREACGRIQITAGARFVEVHEDGTETPDPDERAQLVLVDRCEHFAKESAGKDQVVCTYRRLAAAIAISTAVFISGHLTGSAFPVSRSCSFAHSQRPSGRGECITYELARRSTLATALHDGQVTFMRHLQPSILAPAGRA